MECIYGFGLINCRPFNLYIFFCFKEFLFCNYFVVISPFTLRLIKLWDFSVMLYLIVGLVYQCYVVVLAMFDVHIHKSSMLDFKKYVASIFG